MAPCSLILALNAMRLLRKGCQGFFMFVHDMEAKEAKLENTPVVNEFLDVFSINLLGLPPKKETEFYINLILRT